MRLRTRIAGLAAGLVLTVAVAIPVFAEGSEGGREPADLPPEIQAALEIAREEAAEAREARMAAHEAAVELRNLIEEGDVDEERLEELRAEVERLREIAEKEAEEARAAFETVRELMEEAGLEPLHDRSGGGKRDGNRRGRHGDSPRHEDGDSREKRHEDSPRHEDGDSHGNSSLRTRSEAGSAVKGLRRAGGGGVHEFELGGMGLLQQ